MRTRGRSAPHVIGMASPAASSTSTRRPMSSSQAMVSTCLRTVGSAIGRAKRARRWVRQSERTMSSVMTPAPNAQRTVGETGRRVVAVATEGAGVAGRLDGPRSGVPARSATSATPAASAPSPTCLSGSRIRANAPTSHLGTRVLASGSARDPEIARNQTKCRGAALARRSRAVTSHAATRSAVALSAQTIMSGRSVMVNVLPS
jgi:hypothetical protein